MRRRTILMLMAMAAMVVLAAGVALAEIRVGTDASETLTGTNSADRLTGMAGNDTLKGLAANDVYHFDDGFGDDTLTETAFVQAGTERLPGGIDTLTFYQVSNNSNLTIRLVPQASAQSYNRVDGDNGDSVNLGTSPVENATGGAGGDSLTGGSAKNTLSGGPGGSDDLADYGGTDGNAAFPALAASSDTYKGFTLGTGHDGIYDFGGTADKLDLRPLDSYDVSFFATDRDGNAANGNESLRIVINDTNSVTVTGHFSPISQAQENGRMEQIIFSNEVVTNAAQLNALM
jgi:hypothetical protein